MDIKEQIKSDPSYAFLKTNPKLNGNIILLGLGGSLAYGTNTPASDIDIRGIATRSAVDIVLSRDFETIVDENTDTTIYSLDKILSLLTDCNPNCIELLGLRPQDYLSVNETGKILLENKKIFLSKRCIHTFGGYANQQLYRLRQKSLSALSEDEYNDHIVKVINGMNDHLQTHYGITTEQIQISNTNDGLKINICNMPEMNLETFNNACNEINNVIREYNKASKRNEKAMAHAKLNKHAMHLIRLFMMAVDLLNEQEIITYREKDHDTLMAIRNGDLSDSDGNMSKEFWTLLDEWESKFQKAKDNTKLPENPNFDAINIIKATINTEIVTKNALLDSIQDFMQQIKK